MEKIYIISVGGSLMVPEEISIKFLKNLKKLILKRIKFKEKFILICGGGKTCRKYQDSAKKISNIDNDEKDWLGIHSSRLNGHLLRTIFKKNANKILITNYIDDLKKIKNFKEKILIGAGWKPGWSTDYCAVLCAKFFGIKDIINLSNIKYLYNKDPNKYKTAKKIENINWNDFQKIVGTKWTPGMNAPFDPIATKLAKKLKLKVGIMNGNLKNIEKYLNNKKFVGSIIN